MLNGFKPGKIYLACGYTDLRRGIDGLAGIIQEQFQLDAFDDTLFLFCERRTDRIKGLCWDKNGVLLLYKRLERGTSRWPRATQEARQITAQQYEWLCNGFEIEPRNEPVDNKGLKSFIVKTEHVLEPQFKIELAAANGSIQIWNSVICKRPNEIEHAKIRVFRKLPSS